MLLQSYESLEIMAAIMFRTRAYFNVQLMTITNGNCAVVVVNFEQEQWKSVEKNGEKCEILRMNDEKM